MGFELKGGIDPNNKDTVLAYTLGEGNWLSDTAVNLQVLRDETKMKSEQTVGRQQKEKEPSFCCRPA